MKFLQSRISDLAEKKTHLGKVLGNWMGLNATVAAHKSAVTAFTSACHMSMAAAGHALRTQRLAAASLLLKGRRPAP